MTNRKIFVLALTVLLAGTSAGFAAGRARPVQGRSDNVGGSATGGGMDNSAPDKAGASVVDIPDMAIGGPTALDVTKELPSTAAQRAPRTAPPASAPPQ